MRLAILGFCLVACSAESPVVQRLYQATLPVKGPPAPAIHPFGGGPRGSPVQLASIDARTYAWVADADASVMRIVDLDALELVSTLPLGGEPSEMVMFEDGSLAVALRDTSELLRITAGTKPSIRARIDIATEPLGLALTNETLLVASGWGRTLTAVATHSFVREWKVELDREPRSVVVSDGRAVVSHAVGATIDVVDLDTHAVASRDPDGVAEGGLVRSRRAVQGFALASDNERVFAPRVLAQTARVSDFGWMMKRPKSREESTPDTYGGVAGDPFLPEVLDVVVLDREGHPDRESLALRSGFPTVSCALPRAALATPDGRLVVACVGNDIVAELDALVPSPHHAEIRETKVPAGPTGLAWDEKHESIVVWSRFARQLSLIPTGAIDDGRALAAIAMPAIDADANLARGRVLFHSTGDTRISKDGRACASCHPDGRDDGLVWETKEGPRQTMMLSGRLERTAPFGWLGQSKDVAEHMKTRTFKRLGGTGLPQDDLDALVLYVKSLRPPEPKASAIGALALEGEAIFDSEGTQCASCHGADGRSPDGIDHAVWSKTDRDVTGLFDTPSLRHVAQTAPYFHDGRYATLGELLRKVDGTMGHTKQLSPHELEALEAFLVTR